MTDNIATEPAKLDPPAQQESAGEVTQADLNAAADLIEQYWSGSDASMIALAHSTRAGHRQGAFPRAFARHRIQSTAALQAALDSANSTIIQMCMDQRALEAKLAKAREGETLDDLIAWGDETFGPCDADRAVKRAEEELAEYWDETDPDKKAIEAADTIICLLRVPGIIEAINTKMAINRKRTWRLMGDGTGYHVKSGEIEP